MSGVKQYLNLGRKFESGASKRKIKAELQQKNLELGRSLSTFFKNVSPSASNKDVGKNENGELLKTVSLNYEIICKHRASAEATCCLTGLHL
jgi:hypothetical protein